MYRMLDIQASGCEAGAQDSTNGHLDGKGEDGSKCSKGKCHRVVGGESRQGLLRAVFASGSTCTKPVARTTPAAYGASTLSTFFL